MGKNTCPVCNQEFDGWAGMRRHQGMKGHTREGNEKLDTESYIERYQRVRKEIPQKYRDAYEDITGQGPLRKLCKRRFVILKQS